MPPAQDSDRPDVLPAAAAAERLRRARRAKGLASAAEAARLQGWNLNTYASNENGEIFLINSYIPEYLQANRFNHETKRPRKLLLHKKEIAKLFHAISRDGMTIVPLKLFFNDQGRAKVEVALAKGKKLHDKRETEKQRDWDREKGRLLRDRG